MNYQDARDAIIALVEEGQSLDGLDKLRAVLAYPAELSTEDMAEALLIFGQIAEDFDDPELSGMARAAAGRVDEDDALYAFAHAAFQRQLHVIAAAALARAHRLSPNNAEIISELCANLEALNQHHAALELLSQGDVARRDPLCGYLLAFFTIMTGQLAQATTLVGNLDRSEPDMGPMVDELESMLVRAATLSGHTPLDAADLRGWHAVINGSLLLHLSPHGFDQPMRGRYAYVSDSYALLRDGLDSLRVALAAAGLKPARVWALPERSSRIVARAAGKVFGVPVMEWPEQGSEEPGLIVAYDLDAELPAAVLQALSEHRPGQILWAHGSRWTDVFPYAPDITTFLYQMCASPWGGGGMHVDPASGDVTTLEPDDAPLDELAERILQAERPEEFFDASGPVEALVRRLAELPADHAVGLFRVTGPRQRQRVGSPVTSSRFD